MKGELVEPQVELIRDDLTAEELLTVIAQAESARNWIQGKAFSLLREKHGWTDEEIVTKSGLSRNVITYRRLVWERFGCHLSDKVSWTHYREALRWDDSAECLKWAEEQDATVAEMKAWRRSQHGEDLTAPAEPEPNPEPEPRRSQPSGEVDAEDAQEQSHRSGRNERASGVQAKPDEPPRRMADEPDKPAPEPDKPEQATTKRTLQECVAAARAEYFKQMSLVDPADLDEFRRLMAESPTEPELETLPDETREAGEQKGLFGEIAVPKLTGLLKFAHRWNSWHEQGLVPVGVKIGKSGQVSEALQKAYKRASQHRELRDLIVDLDAIEEALQATGEFFRGGKWTRPETIVGGKNKDGTWMLVKLLEGGFAADRTTGPSNSFEKVDWEHLIESAPVIQSEPLRRIEA